MKGGEAEIETIIEEESKREIFCVLFCAIVRVCWLKRVFLEGGRLDEELNYLSRVQQEAYKVTSRGKRGTEALIPG